MRIVIMLGKIRNGLAQIGISVLCILSFLIVTYLFYLAGFSTSVTNASEHTWLIEDSFIRNMFWVILILAVIGIAKAKSAGFRSFVKRLNEDAAFCRKCRRYMLVLLGVICLAAVIVLQKVPVNDQRTVCDIANSMMNHDYYAFERGGYIDEYPNQLGMVLFLYGMTHLFGGHNYMVFQLLNVAALLGIYSTLAELSDLTGHERTAGTVILAIGIVFWPAILYVTFVYGTLIGLFLSVRAMRHAVVLNQAADLPAARRLMMAAVIAAESFLAIALKQNYMINAVALIILLMLMTLRPWRRRETLKMTGTAAVSLWNLALAAVLMATLMLSGKIVTKTAEKITGMDIGSGISSLSWVAMGLQENTDRYDGWYNGYNVESYENANSSRERQEPVVRECIAKRLQEFAAHPGKALQFFSGKNASQWNNPDFQSMWSVVRMRNNVSYAGWTHAIFTAGGTAAADAVMNRLQFVILFGGMSYFLTGFMRFRKRRKSGAELYQEKANDMIWDPAAAYMLTTVLGGFIFHTFWEAKAQYTFPYFVLLIPAAAYGFDRICLPAAGNGIGFSQNDDAAAPRTMVRAAACPLMVLLAGGCVIYIGMRCGTPLRTIFAGNDGTDEYRQYLAEQEYVQLADGDYILAAGSEDDGNSFVDESQHSNANAKTQTESASDSIDAAESAVSVHLTGSDYDRSCWIATADGQTAAADDDAMRYGDEETYSAAMEGITYADNQRWKLRKAEKENEYYLIHTVDDKDFALTRNPETGELEYTKCTYSKNQRWILQ